MPRPGTILPALAVLACALLLPAQASGATQEHALASKLARAMRGAGFYSGAFVYNATDRHPVFALRSRRTRILASNTKLFTTTSALLRFGPLARLHTRVLGRGVLDPEGTFHGDLYLRGGGDPTFGSRRFVGRNYRRGATIQTLAGRVQAAGINAVDGHVYGDESLFDRRRGGPASRFRTSVWIGPLSALDYNRGLADERGTAFQRRPAKFAALRLRAVLARRGIHTGTAGVARTPSSAQPLATVDSPSMARLIQLTNKPSDNFFAEMLLKDVAAFATGKGTTARGARLARRSARQFGSFARLADGAGLSRRDRASPYRIARLLLGMRARPEFPAFYGSLSIAGRDGTLAPRMRRGPAHRHCRGKTGTLSNVSALSGYCKARSGDVYVFSILMNNVTVDSARRLQDRMAQAIAAVRAPAGVSSNR
ncbi:MAG: D-alanyl-D-alanine carboxypeptidase/D-alanyl-D-alanine-endopeptidase [Thermoleophilaceae bacterium]